MKSSSTSSHRCVCCETSRSLPEKRSVVEVSSVSTCRVSDGGRTLPQVCHFLQNCLRLHSMIGILSLDLIRSKLPEPEDILIEINRCLPKFRQIVDICPKYVARVTSVRNHCICSIVGSFYSVIYLIYSMKFACVINMFRFYFIPKMLITNKYLSVYASPI